MGTADVGHLGEVIDQAGIDQAGTDGLDSSNDRS
jgi:hypothetical protein